MKHWRWARAALTEFGRCEIESYLVPARRQVDQGLKVGVGYRPVCRRERQPVLVVVNSHSAVEWSRPRIADLAVYKENFLIDLYLLVSSRAFSGTELPYHRAIQYRGDLRSKGRRGRRQAHRGSRPRRGKCLHSISKWLVLLDLQVSHNHAISVRREDCGGSLRHRRGGVVV